MGFLLLPRRQRQLAAKLLGAATVTWILWRLVLVGGREGSISGGQILENVPAQRQAAQANYEADNTPPPQNGPPVPAAKVTAEKNAKSHSSRSSSSSKNNLKGGEEQGGVIAAPHNPEGPGEMGRPVVVNSPDPDTKRKIDEGWQNNAFNQYVSDMISVHRTLPDFRRVSLLFKHNYLIT
jgi:hypothetical protein